MDSKAYDYGVHYKPSSVSNKALTLDQLKQSNISYVRVQVLDYTNTVRCRILSVPYFLAMLDSTRPGMGISKAVLGAVFHTLAEGFSSSGEYLCVPDLSSLRICPYSPKHAAVMAWLQEKTPYPSADNKLTVDVQLCPRAILQRIVRRANASGVSFLVGFESEFILLKSTRPVEAVQEHYPMDTKALLAGSIEEKLLEEISDGIQASGIELQLYHAEAAPGQFEVVTGPLTPLEAADALVHTREIILHTAAKHGLRATFAPRINTSAPGSSAHVHISVHSQRAIKTAEALSSPESSFLASLLTNLPAVTALTMPIPVSYQRMVDGIWSGGTYVSWGTENREAPIRLTNATSPSSRNFEIRCVDATANPYIALAGILGLGLDGIEKGVELTMQDCPGPVPAANMTEEGRRALGITTRMPLSWEESRSKFKMNKLLTESILGPEFTETYLVVNQCLAESLNAGGEDDEANLRRLVEFY
ncbi:hypothetical protein M413DRAFT_440624 [Hebeloma cylindrosporum]|uniref:Glutamine synthetase n=1 Tax=Hebeloma cylindrosporum TaxID=76867 RepID=A0A0C3CSR9_HEBCY|nr:hypothetical protein M413DRAFT_440624 [Hebeloma cylindrosporum h7]